MTLKEFDRSHLEAGIEFIAGFDEAGRGPICGPVTAAGVVVRPEFFHPLINDSKQLSEKQRLELYPLIIENALAYSIVFVSPQEIDAINILEASRVGMERALESMLASGQRIDLCLTDYMKLRTPIKTVPLKKGDATSFSIACASILAKVARDRYMTELGQRFPQYELERHKGYPTARHLELLERHGVEKSIYRLSYAPVRRCLAGEEPVH